MLENFNWTPTSEMLEGLVLTEIYKVYIYKRKSWGEPFHQIIIIAMKKINRFWGCNVNLSWKLHLLIIAKHKNIYILHKCCKVCLWITESLKNNHGWFQKAISSEFSDPILSKSTEILVLLICFKLISGFWKISTIICQWTKVI